MMVSHRILLELNYILMLTFPLVLFEKHALTLFTSAGSTFISYSAQHMRKGSAVKGPHDHRPKEIEIIEYLPAYDEAKIGLLASVFTV